MSQLLSLSRAARLVGVNRSELQRRIKQGELSSFDGMVGVDDLLRAYPDVQLEDNTEYRRVSLIKEKAFGKRIFERAMPDVETLAVRVSELSRELTLSRLQQKNYKTLLERLRSQLDEVERVCVSEAKPAINSLKKWLGDEVKAAMEPDYPNPLAIRDNLLRVVAAHVSVLPGKNDFFIDGPDSILEGALRAGIPLNYGCSGGNCGLCKAKIISGQVKKTRFHDFVLSDADKQNDIILMCSNTAMTDLVIEATVAGGVQDIPYQQISATVKSVTDLTPDMALLHLQTPRSNRLRFLAGQSVNLKLGNSVTATLPIASCPCDDRNILFHLRRLPGNVFSDYAFNKLKNHEVVEIEGPQGEFILQEKSTRPLYFIAFDQGFAPIKSLVEHAMSLEAAEAIHLYWIGSHESSIYLPNVGRAWADALDNFHYNQLLANFDLANLGGNREKQLEELLQSILNAHPDLSAADVYIAGPQASSASAENFFLGLGMPKTRVFASHV